MQKIHEASLDRLLIRARNLLELRAERRERDDELLHQARKRLRESRVTLQRSAESLQMGLVARAALTLLLPPSP